MLKLIKLETYYPDKKIIDLIEKVTNSELKITNGIARLIEKTNIKQVSPVIYETKINNNNFVLWHYKADEFKSNCFYMPSLKETFNIKELQELIENY